MSKIVKIPGPEHPISVAPARGRVVVTAGGRVIADTRTALTVREATYPAVHYIPRKDTQFLQLRRSAHTTYCPYKGEASYYHLPNAENAVWSYENPHPAMAAIKDHLAFYPDRVDAIEITEE